MGLMYMFRVVWSSVLLGVGDYCILALSGLGYWRDGLYKGFLDNEPVWSEYINVNIARLGHSLDSWMEDEAAILHSYQ
jgi:hypothetical protein